MTLRKLDYHIGTGNQVNINKVVVCTMCKNPKKTLQKERLEEGIEWKCNNFMQIGGGQQLHPRLEEAH